MTAETKNKPRASVVGGGISGLTAARNLADAGYEVEVIESSSRLGGKIQTTQMANGTTIERGAEFVDTDHKSLIQLSEQLGVKFTKATDQAKADLVLSNGKKLSAAKFAKMIEPLQKKLAEDKAIIASNPSGNRALELDNMSLTQYLNAASDSVRPEEPTGIFASMGRMLQKLNPFHKEEAKEGINPEALGIISGAFTAEMGRTPDKISARQYVQEASTEKGEILASDCGLRVQGGTERIIDALKADLEKKGVKFKYDAETASVGKQDGKFRLTMKDGTQTSTDKVVFAVPAGALGKIEGLETLGISQETIDTLRNTQYTHSSKFSVATRQDAKDSCMFTNEGFQAWRSGPGVVTFLAGGEEMNSKKGAEVVQHCLESYAKAQGSTVEKMFDVSKITYSGVSTDKPCYCSPGTGQSTKLAKLSQNLESMAESGVGIVGTYIPQKGGSVGFMESGVQSANRVTAIMAEKSQQNEVSTPELDQEKWRNFAKTARSTPSAAATR